MRWRIWNFPLKVFEAGRDSVKAFKKWRLQGPRIEKAAILGRKRNRDATPIWSWTVLVSPHLVLWPLIHDEISDCATDSKVIGYAKTSLNPSAHFTVTVSTSPSWQVWECNAMLTLLQRGMYIQSLLKYAQSSPILVKWMNLWLWKPTDFQVSRPVHLSLYPAYCWRYYECLIGQLLQMHAGTSLSFSCVN